MWYGSLSTALELFGPSRYHWDNGYFSLDIERRVKSVDSVFLNKGWDLWRKTNDLGSYGAMELWSYGAMLYCVISY